MALDEVTPVEIGDLELRHLVALRTVAALGTFGRAAEALGYTQSAISQQVASLERAIGQPVFVRRGGPRPVTLTPAGALLLERAEDILDRVSVALSDLEQLRDGERGRIRLGSFQSVSVHLAPPLLRRLRTERPLVDVELFETDDAAELERRVLSGELDATFLVRAPEGQRPGLEMIDLFTDPYLVVVPAGEPDGPFPAHSLRTRPVIGNPVGVCERIVNEALRADGIDPQYEFQTADNGAVHAMVANGMGVAVMPRLAIDPDYPDVAIRELDPPVPARKLVIARREGAPGPLTAAVVETALAVVAEMGLRSVR